MQFLLYTIGCQMNEYDTSAYEKVLYKYGYKKTNHIESSDLVILNTCAVREKSIKKALSFLGIAKKVKQKKPQLIVAMIGCASMLILRELKHRTWIDFVWGALNQTEPPEAFLEMLQKKGISQTEETDQDFQNQFSVNIPIIFGCDSFCTYCIVPFLRGREKSIPPEQLFRYLEKANHNEVKEIVLLGQNVNHYGIDLVPPIHFASLLDDMASLYPSIRFDFLTSHPKDFDIRILQVMEKNENIYRHFHLPAQHGDTGILKAMNRQYTREEYIRLIQQIRSYFPMATLSTDLIVGFPGETDDAFQNLLDLVDTVGFDMIFAAQYSKRPGTAAEKMDAQIPEEIKKQRINLLLEKQKSISKRQNQRWIGQQRTIIITEKKDEKTFIGKTIEEKMVTLIADNLILGSECLVNISAYHHGSLYGEIVDNK